MWNDFSVAKSLQFIVATSQDTYGRQIRPTVTDAQLLGSTHLPEEAIASPVPTV